MTKVDDGGSAFPIPEDETNLRLYGMSLRDWFAGHAPPPCRDQTCRPRGQQLRQAAHSVQWR